MSQAKNIIFQEAVTALGLSGRAASPIKPMPTSKPKIRPVKKSGERFAIIFS